MASSSSPHSSSGGGIVAVPSASSRLVGLLEAMVFVNHDQHGGDGVAATFQVAERGAVSVGTSGNTATTVASRGNRLSVSTTSWAKVRPSVSSTRASTSRMR